MLVTVVEPEADTVVVTVVVDVTVVTLPDDDEDDDDEELTLLELDELELLELEVAELPLPCMAATNPATWFETVNVKGVNITWLSVLLVWKYASQAACE